MKNTVFTILLFPLVVLFLLYMILITPVDYLIYKRSRYYKDTKEKYSWFCGTSYHIRFYDMIKKENLPIDYYRCDYAQITGYGFFVYKDVLILDYFDLCYDEEKHIWLVEIEDEYVDVKEDIDGAIDRCNGVIGNDICKKAVVLMDEDAFREHHDVKYDNVYFWPAKNNADFDAIKAIIMNY